MWQCSVSDCSPSTHGNFTGCDWRPWLGAEATRCSKHGRDYLLAWQLFFSPLLPASFQFCWMRQYATLSSRYLATAADGWNLLFPKSRGSFSILLTYNTPSESLASIPRAGVLVQHSVVIAGNRVSDRRWLSNHFQHRSNFIFKSWRDQQIMGAHE